MHSKQNCEISPRWLHEVEKKAPEVVRVLYLHELVLTCDFMSYVWFYRYIYIQWYFLPPLPLPLPICAPLPYTTCFFRLFLAVSIWYIPRGKSMFWCCVSCSRPIYISFHIVYYFAIFNSLSVNIFNSKDCEKVARAFLWIFLFFKKHEPFIAVLLLKVSITRCRFHAMTFNESHISLSLSLYLTHFDITVSKV